METNKIVYCPNCQAIIWDIATIDQQLNKCWNCGLKFVQGGL